MNSSWCGKNRNLLVATLVFLTVLGVVSYRGSNRFVENGSQVARSYQILEKIETIQLLLQEDESALRGYLLAGDKKFLKPVPEIRVKLATGTNVLSSDLEMASEASEITGTYDNTKVGPLRFSLAYDADEGALQMVVKAPDGQTYLWRDYWHLDVPEAMIGKWAYTISVLHAPADFPFKLTIKHLTVPEMLAKLIKTEGSLTLGEDDIETNKKKGKFAEEFRKLVVERLEYSNAIFTSAATSLEAGRAIFAEGKGQEMLQRIDARAEELRTLEEAALQQQLVEVRQSAEFLGGTVVGMHFVYMAIVVFGLVLILVGGACHWQWVRNLWFRMIHLTMILIVVVETILAIKCPLTVWEKDLKLAADLKAEEGGFIARWMHNMIIFDWADPVKDEWMFSIGYICFGVLVLLSFWLVPPCLPRKPVCKVTPTSPPPGDANHRGCE